MRARLVAIALVLFASCNALAGEFTDVWYTATEPGWGMFLVQSEATQVAAFFIYGADGKPTWYTAQLQNDGTGKFTGSLYAISGTYFASPWQGYTIAPAGTASFTPADPYHATLSYTVNGIPTVNKAVQRQTLTAYNLPGNYSGSMAGSVSGCNDPARNDPAFRARYVLVATQDADASAGLQFTFVDNIHNGLVCNVNGPLTHLGRIYQLNGTLQCMGLGTDGNPHAVVIDALHPTGQGIEGHLTGSSGGGCTASLHFAAVLNVNQ
jgi:hypothetical protein